MELPKTIKIGAIKYTVLPVKQQVFKGCLGFIDYDGADIMVSTSKDSRPRSDAAVAQTFWHEVTHGILYDMGHRLESNEKFVEQFSRRLSNAIRSAKF
jgi:hypothetical protein